MNASNACYAIIKHYESLQLDAYLCPAGKLTIGYGHVLLPDEKFRKIDEVKAYELLENDIKWAENVVNDAVCVDLTQWHFDALTSFTFNVGANAFIYSSMLKLLNLGDYKGAANQFPKWVYANNEILKGLVNRRKSEQDLFNGYGVIFYD